MVKISEWNHIHICTIRGFMLSHQETDFKIDCQEDKYILYDKNIIDTIRYNDFSERTNEEQLKARFYVLANRLYFQIELQ